jgi:hypothetical protein
MPNSVLNPQISEPTSDLQTLAMQALRRYGDFAASSVDGEVLLMFLEFANLIIDEVRAHPYYVEAYENGLIGPLPYYTSQTDKRPLPDQIIIAGLLYHYALQQGSNKVQAYIGNFARTMNQQLWGILHGHGKIEMTVVDDGSRGGRS